MIDKPAAVTVVADEPYAVSNGATLRADVVVPRLTGGPVPAVIWIHGGGWRYGSRRVAPDLTRFFAERGLAMVAIDYRLSDRAIFPAQIEDVKTAIRWLRSSALRFGIDRDRIGLWGASAGGHLAALAALSICGRFDPPGRSYAEESSEVQAVVAGYPPVDFLRLDSDRPDERAVIPDPENLSLPHGMRSADASSFESLLLGAPIGACPERVRDANPITYARPGAPPFLLLHGLSDTTVGSRQSERLFDALAAHGNDVMLCLIERLGHGFLNRNHLDDGPPRAMTVRTCRAGRVTTEQRAQAVFPLIEVFLRTRLSGPS